MKNYILLLVSTLLLSSCGAFLQHRGLKNYKPIITVSNTSLNKYQYDFNYLTALCEQTFPNSDSIFNKNEREQFKAEIYQRLGEGTTDDLAFLIQCKRYVAKFQNQHTNIHLKVKMSDIFPYVVFVSNNKWFLLNVERTVDSTHIGKEIVTVNDQPTELLITKLKTIVAAENEIAQLHQIKWTQLYNKPDILFELGAITQRDSLKLTFEDGKSVVLHRRVMGQFKLYSVKAKSNTLTKYSNTTYSYQLDSAFAYLQFNACFDKIALLEGINDYLKPIIRPMARGYLKYQFSRKRTTKRLAGMYNTEYPIFKDFLHELFTKMKESKMDKLIIDLRYNSGGDFELCRQLLYYLSPDNNLQDFKEYMYTSDVYRIYFSKEYKAFERKYVQENHQKPPQNKLLLNHQKAFFYTVTDTQSPYFIEAGRPVFKGQVYILANQNTGSAAALLTAIIQDNGFATVIGTSVGNNPTGATTYTPFKLPNTKASVSIASTYLERPDVHRDKVLIPDVWIEPSFIEWLDGKDTLLETAKR